MPQNARSNTYGEKMKRLNFLLLFLFFPNIAMAKAIDEVVTYGSKISPGAFGILLVASLFHARHWFYLKNRDGWSWDKHAQRALFVSALCSNILSLYWPEKVFLHVASQWWIFSGVIANAVLRWALTENILRVKFQDPFEIKRHRHASYKFTQALSLLGILSCCGSLLTLPWLPFTQDIILAATIAWTCSKFDWIYVLRNSPLSSTLFTFSMFSLGVAQPLHIDPLSYVMIYFMLGASFLRIRAQLEINREAILVTKAAFASMQTMSNGAEKLDALCMLLQDEWAMARVSVVTIENKYGTLVASSGPQALNTNNIVPQLLGPILKRVCREAHSVYSPVAGELGKENVFHRLRHSSFAVPIFFQEKIAAVICFMAEGEEKIDQQDVRAMDMVCRQITPEILAAIISFVPPPNRLAQITFIGNC